MTPHLRRLSTATLLLLLVVACLSFAVGRITRPTEEELEAARSKSQVAAYRVADREAYARERVRGYAAGASRGRRAAHRAAKARARTLQVQAEAAAAAATPAPTASPGPSQAYAGQAPSTNSYAYSGQQSSSPSSSSGAGSGASGSSSTGTAAGTGTQPNATTQGSSGKASKPTQGAGSPTVIYSERRSYRWREEWTASTAGTTRTYSARTSYRATTSSGSTVSTRVRTARTVYWSTASSP